MKFLILYSTQTGTTQYVAESMRNALGTQGQQAVAHDVRSGQPDFNSVDVVLLGAPTYEDGKIEDGMAEFLATTSWSPGAYKVAVFGLGSHSYANFCAAATKLEEWVKAHGGVVLVPLLKINGFPEDLTPIEQWLKDVQARL